MRRRLTVLLVAAVLAVAWPVSAQVKIIPAPYVNGAGVAIGSIDLPASAYLNWGSTLGTTGYGVRDNAGAIEFKNSGGAWTALTAATNYWQRVGTVIKPTTAGDSATIDGNLVVSGVGPHAIGGAGYGSIQTRILGTFTPSVVDNVYALGISTALIGQVAKDIASVSISGALTEAASGTHSVLAGLRISAIPVTAGGGSQVVATRASLYIAGAMTGGTAPTNDYALFVVGGANRFGGAVTMDSTLGVTGTATISGGTSGVALSVYGNQSTAPLGTEVVTNGTFSDLTGWTADGTWTAAGTAAHSSTTTTLACNQLVVATSTYQVVFTVAGAMSVTVTVGDTSVINTGATATFGAGTYTRSVVAATTAGIIFTPTDATGSIDNVSVKPITVGGATAVVAFYDDADVNFAGIRGSFALKNLAFGYQSLQSNTTGSNNTASGYAALQSNTTGSYNTASGLYALQSNTTGSYNTASGIYALYANTTGSYNTASGIYALQSNTTGSYNTASGYAALQSNTTGSYNTASGLYALHTNTTGSNNTASGIYALQSNTTGSYNTASGLYALYANTTGSNNVGIGYEAGRYITAGTNLTASDDSVFIGALTRAADVSQNNQIVIGYNARGAGSNTTVIGNSSVTDVYFGSATGLSNLTANRGIFNGGSDTLRAATFTSYSGSSLAGLAPVLMRSARGTLASPTASQTGDYIGGISGAGYGATAFAATSRAGVNLIAAENWTDAAQGAYITLGTTPIGSTTRFDRIKIADTGLVTFGGNGPANSDAIAIHPYASGAGTFTGTLTSVDLTGNVSWTLPNASVSFPAPVDGYLIASSATGYKTVRDVWTESMGLVKCAGATPTSFVNTPSGGTAAGASCTVGTYQTRGTEDLADGGGTHVFMIPVHLTDDYDSTGAVKLELYWQSVAASGDAIFNVQTACIANGGATDVAWNAAQPVTQTTAGANLRNIASIASLTITGCSADNMLWIRVDRDGGATGDTLGATAQLARIEVQWFRKW